MMGACAMPHVLDWWLVQMQSCADTHALGMSQSWFVALVSGLAGVALIALYCQRARLKRAKAEVGCTCCAALRCAVIYQLFNSCVVQYIAQCRYLSIPLSCHWMRQVATNLRIVLGAGQVLSLLSGVLKLVFPTEARAALGVVTIFVAGAPLSATGAGRFLLCVAHLTRTARCRCGFPGVARVPRLGLVRKVDARCRRCALRGTARDWRALGAAALRRVPRQAIGAG